MVQALEHQYDFRCGWENRSLLARDEDLPAARELGAEFERFLAEHADEYRANPGGNRGLTPAAGRPAA